MFLGFCIILGILLVLYIWFSFKSPNIKNKHYYMDEFDDDVDFYTSHKEAKHNDTFPYPDPYELSGDKAMFLDEEGEILDDL